MGQQLNYNTLAPYLVDSSKGTQESVCNDVISPRQASACKQIGLTFDATLSVFFGQLE